MSRIKFKVNGLQCSVGCEIDSNLMLLDYIREHLEYRGTKYMCREGGCGACIVAAVKCPGGPTLAVNSCLISITSCQDWEITTIEDVGNRLKGYHVLQKTLADSNGSQCGYCSPAWIMNMYSLLKNGNEPTMLEVEQAFGSNVCRCTGYRPILDAFKKFAQDSPNKAPNEQIIDIEDSNICKKTGSYCSKTSCDYEDWCLIDVEDKKIIKIKLKDCKCWYKVYNISSIFQILDKKRYDSYMLVFGNTAKGAYPIKEYPKILIDITSISELRVVELDQNLIVGAGLTLTELLDTFKTMAREEYFWYLDKLYDHLKLVAHIPVRNLGSVGGNLMIKHKHKDFSSDIFLLFETVGAYLTIVTAGGITTRLTMQQFLKEDMKKKVIINILLPPLSKENKIYTCKVMPRSQNAHAIVNAGFFYKLSSKNTVLEARMVYGGLSPLFIRAKVTERFLLGQSLFTNETLQSSLKILQSEVVVTENLPNPSVEYRKHLALALFYKGLINLCPKDTLNERFNSERVKIHDTRPLSQGTQVFDTNPALWPLNQPIPKVEALIQCAGETKYVDDINTIPHQVYAVFALTTVALGEIVSIDASKALEQQGVIAFYSAKDIPGLNSFMPLDDFLTLNNEEVLCSGNVKYYNQPFGIVVAESQHIAEIAAEMVTVTYKNIRAPVMDVIEAKNDSRRLILNTKIDATDRGTDVVKVIKGENTIYGQYHFTMENLACVTKPTEEGLVVFPTSHWIDATQVMISRALKISENRIDVHVRRIGGSFGMKMCSSIRVSVACSLVTHKLNLPCRFVVPMTTTTRAIGKRLPCHTEFTCQVNSAGVIQYIDYKLYEDHGYQRTLNFNLFVAETFQNCYREDRWDFKGYDVVTDTPGNTWCRSPASLESISMAEMVLERISYELSLDPFVVRIANLDDKYKELIEMANNLKSAASYEKRKASVIDFNANNRWRKRGLRVSFSRWHSTFNLVLDINLTVFHADGTVIITHGAIEMGQGVNTVAVQVAAYYLNIPISKIQVKENNSIITPNCTQTGNSLGSQNVTIGIRKCCEDLLNRLEPIRRQMTNPTWEELIVKAYESNVDLQVHGYVGADDVYTYEIYGAALAEVEVDILTGESEIRRVDLIQDVGQSINPKIDIGQIEGAFTMGIGYWTCENLVYDKKSGELLSDRTWNYYVPLARDIPQDFRVYFRKKSYSFEPILGAKAEIDLGFDKYTIRAGGTRDITLNSNLIVATGEPPMCLSVVTAFALREAIAEARCDSGIPRTSWFQIDGPLTVEKIALAAATKIEDYKLTC